MEDVTSKECLVRWLCCFCGGSWDVKKETIGCFGGYFEQASGGRAGDLIL